MTEAQAVPLFNVYSALVYALKGSDVQDVIVNGRVVVKQRQPQTLDRARVLAAARAYAERISLVPRASPVAFAVFRRPAFAPAGWSQGYLIFILIILNHLRSGMFGNTGSVRPRIELRVGE
jgi:hypothetical protein